MNIDVLYTLTSRFDNTTLALLSRISLWNVVKNFTTDQHWWFLRIQHLMNAELTHRQNENWKEAYLSLKKIDWTGDNNPFMNRSRLTTAILLMIQHRITV